MAKGNTTTLISVIINNFNYGAYLSKAIESVLSQKNESLEIIVVDDGSTDNSREIINRYSNQIKIIYKENGGQASAINAGSNASSGSWIWFLDADDFLKPNAVELLAIYLDDHQYSKIHGYLEAADNSGASLYQRLPAEPLSEGNVRDRVVKLGNYIWPPTSGNIFSRKFLTALGPVPENEYRICGDLYLCTSAAFYGDIKRLDFEIGYYRIHQNNNFHGYKLQSDKWLKIQAMNIIQAQKLVSKLVQTHLKTDGYTFPWSRRNLELLMVAKRFSSSGLDEYSKYTLSKLWWTSIRQSHVSGYAVIEALALWTSIALAPKPFARLTLKAASHK